MDLDDPLMVNASGWDEMTEAWRAEQETEAPGAILRRALGGGLATQIPEGTRDLFSSFAARTVTTTDRPAVGPHDPIPPAGLEWLGVTVMVPDFQSTRSGQLGVTALRVLMLSLRTFLALGEFGHVPVVMDLTRAPGDYFSIVLPNGVGYRDVVSFIHPRTRSDWDDCMIYIGHQLTPCVDGPLIRLNLGEVMTATGPGMNPPFQSSLSQLLVPSAAVWGPLHHVPREHRAFALCLYFEGGRRVLLRHHLYGHTVRETVCRVLADLHDS
ncbi:unnamed protein product [Symbiodinium microadriaticum]|nr:unnamed protein product [Symbiodinium sp. KB8]CAE7905140.1 unnamed protein product [Symbiodinium microadriaticum]